jgi:hypothetical protein
MSTTIKQHNRHSSIPANRINQISVLQPRFLYWLEVLASMLGSALVLVGDWKTCFRIWFFLHYLVSAGVRPVQHAASVFSNKRDVVSWGLPLAVSLGVWSLGDSMVDMQWSSPHPGCRYGSGIPPSIFFSTLGCISPSHPAYCTISGVPSDSLPCDKMLPLGLDGKLDGGNDRHR